MPCSFCGEDFDGNIGILAFAEEQVHVIDLGDRVFHVLHARMASDQPLRWALYVHVGM